MTKEEITTAYRDLCYKVGDLYFVRESLTAQLGAVDAQLASLKERRTQLQAALKEAAHDVADPAGQ